MLDGQSEFETRDEDLTVVIRSQRKYMVDEMNQNDFCRFDKYY